VDEAVMAKFEVLSHHMLGWSEEIYKELQAG
jgi:hypothetical protein